MSTETVLRWRGVASVLWLVALLAWETVSPCYAWFRTARDRGRHGLRNLSLAVVNAVGIALLFVGLWSAAAAWAEHRGVGLLRMFPLPDGPRLLLAVLLLDLWTYAWHRANHRLPFLWRFHRVHHSDACMDVTTANRFHLGEIAMSSVLRIPLLVLLGIRFGELVIYETLLQFVVQWHHANVAIPAPAERVLRWFLVTPGLHRVHHSRHQPETDSNFASLFPVWDRLFFSLRLRERPEEIRIGLDGYDDPGNQSVAGLMRTPFRDVDGGNHPSP